LSNTGIVLVRNQKCPILGRVSMNITVVDLTEVEDALVGDEVMIISNKLNDTSLVELAHKCKTIPYELLVHLPESLRREVIE